MKRLNEVNALAIVFGNTRRKKRKENLVTIAKACEYLVKLYGSQKAVAEKVGLSAEMIRQFLSILKLPPEVQDLISKRKIDSVDAARQLVALEDAKKQIAVARKITNILSKDARDIHRIVKGETVPAKKVRQIVLEVKKKGLNIFMLDFDDETYKKIAREAKAAGKQAAELVREVVINWLANRG